MAHKHMKYPVSLFLFSQLRSDSLSYELAENSTSAVTGAPCEACARTCCPPWAHARRRGLVLCLHWSHRDGDCPGLHGPLRSSNPAAPLPLGGTDASTRVLGLQPPQIHGHLSSTAPVLCQGGCCWTQLPTAHGTPTSAPTPASCSLSFLCPHRLPSPPRPSGTPSTVLSRRLAFLKVGDEPSDFKQRLCSAPYSSPGLGKSKGLASSLELGGKQEN